MNIESVASTVDRAVRRRAETEEDHEAERSVVESEHPETAKEIVHQTDRRKTSVEGTTDERDDAAGRVQPVEEDETTVEIK